MNREELIREVVARSTKIASRAPDGSHNRIPIFHAESRAVGNWAICVEFTRKSRPAASAVQVLRTKMYNDALLFAWCFDEDDAFIADTDELAYGLLPMLRSMMVLDDLADA